MKHLLSADKGIRCFHFLLLFLNTVTANKDSDFEIQLRFVIFKKNFDSVQNEFGLVRFKKRGLVRNL